MMVCAECVEERGKERAPFVAYYMHSAALSLLTPCEDYHVLSSTVRGMNSVIIIFEMV